MLSRRLQLISKLPRRFTSESITSSELLYEVRVYQCHPKKFPEFIKLNSSEDFKERLKASKPLGSWRTEVGTLSQVFHIWPYPSVGERARVRQSLAGNERWAAFYPKLADTWQWQTSHICRNLDAVADQPVFRPGIYYYIYSQNINNVFVDNFQIPESSADSVAVLGKFKVVVGDPVGAVYAVLNCNDVDAGYELLAANEKVLEESKSSSSLIYPLPVSPMQ